jgi:hypothetical protein
MSITLDVVKSLAVDKFKRAKPVSLKDEEIVFENPGLMFNAERIARLLERQNQGDPVCSQAIDEAIDTARKLLVRRVSPIEGPLQVPLYYRFKKEHRAVHHRIRRDAISSNAFAMAYALSGDDRFLRKAKEFLFSWVEALEPPQSFSIKYFHFRGDNPIVISYVFPHFIMCMDLLKGYDGASPEEESQFNDWLMPFVDYMVTEESIKNNHHIFQTLFLLCSAHILKDVALFKKSIGFYLNGLRSQINKEGFLPYELIRGERAATYTLMALEGLFQIAHIASLHGVYGLMEKSSYFGGSLKPALDHLLDFILEKDSWSFMRKDLDKPGFAHEGSFSITEIAQEKTRLYDWGYLFEPALSWWKDPRYEFIKEGRPYGLFPSARTYSLSYSTLAFLD